jgi:hypothetical protein
MFAGQRPFFDFESGLLFGESYEKVKRKNPAKDDFTPPFDYITYLQIPLIDASRGPLSSSESALESVIYWLTYPRSLTSPTLSSVAPGEPLI